MSSEGTASAIEVDGLGKCYQIYDRPIDRLKQSLNIGRRKYYREHWALQNISFDVAPGESIGVVGRNGSGKSTLLQLIAGIIPATTGTSLTNGRVAALLELGAGFNPEFSGRENVLLSATLYGLTRAEALERLDDIIAFSEVGDFIDQPVKTYSSGMFMRLAFSIVAHLDADTLIIDEALAVGDAFFVQKCMRFLRKFQERGTILFVSHDTGSVTSLCDRAIWLRDGALEMIGDSKEVCEEYFAARYSEDMGITLRQSNAKPPVRQPVQTPPEPAADSNGWGEQKLQGFWLNPDPKGFGTGQAQISNVSMLDGTGNNVELVEGGEEIVVKVTARCDSVIEHPVIGFSVKDRLGQHLFGDNSSSVTVSVPLDTGSEVSAEFRFSMPLLLTGEYSVCAAIASGTLEQHVQHHWVHDALLFTVHSSSLAGVMVGIPMQSVVLRVDDEVI